MNVETLPEEEKKRKGKDRDINVEGCRHIRILFLQIEGQKKKRKQINKCPKQGIRYAQRD
jgi:hypothetical protein